MRLVQLFLTAPSEHVHKDILLDAGRNWSTPMPKASQVAQTLRMGDKLHLSGFARSMLVSIQQLAEDSERPKFDQFDIPMPNKEKV